MRTSAPTDEHGFSLFETLIVLALFSLMATLAATTVNPRSSSAGLKHATSQLIADLKRARMEAMMTGVPIEVTVNTTGYAIDALGLNRELPRRTTLRLADGAFVFDPQMLPTGTVLSLDDGRSATHVDILPLTGEIRQRTP